MLSSREALAAINVRREPGAEAKLDLLEEFQRHQGNARHCAQRTADWIVANTAATRVVVAALSSTRTAFDGLAGAGVQQQLVERLSLSLDGRGDPIVSAVTNGQLLSLPANRGSARLPVLDGMFPRSSVTVLAIGGQPDEDVPALGLLFFSPASDPVPQSIRWVTEVLGQQFRHLADREGSSDVERRLRRERSWLQHVLNAATDPILFTNTEGRLLIANTRAELLFSATDDVSEGRRRAVQLNNMFFSAALSRRSLGEGEPGRRELVLVDPTDGSDLPFELLSTVVSDPREGTGVVSILRNISDLRQAAQQIDENYARLRVAEADARAERDRLNLIIDSVADPIVVTDEEGAISLMNTPAERLFSAHAGAGEEAQRIVRANDAHFSSFVSGLLSTGGDTTRRGEIGLVSPGTRQPVPVEAFAAKMLSDLGELTAVVTILHDRTEDLERASLYEQLKRASDELEGKVHAATDELARQNELLRRQALELEQASTAKSQFLANVSHELRTPLNAILGYATMTMQGIAGETTPGQRRHLSRIEANGRHLLALINEILDITRIEAGRMPLEIVSFAIPDLLREVQSELEPIIAKSNLTVTTRLGPDLVTLRTDRHKVKQVLVNLLGNALKFTPSGTVTLQAEMVRPKMIALAVSDTGIGIAEADQSVIFDDFRQVDNTPRRAYGGTGLGLSICRRLTMMLRGSISVQSQLGRGSTFTVTLPTVLRK
jgi:signal transduction histidine kinase